jgi:hypothetical protein
MDDPFLLVQFYPDLVLVAVQAERQPHDAIELRNASTNTGGAHPLAEAEQRRFG